MKFSDDVSGFVSIGEMIPDVLLDIRYYSSFNFIGERIDGYEEPAALITREAAQALKAVSDEAARQGLRLKIFVRRRQWIISCAGRQIRQIYE